MSQKSLEKQVISMLETHETHIEGLSDEELEGYKEYMQLSEELQEIGNCTKKQSERMRARFMNQLKQEKGEKIEMKKNKSVKKLVVGIAAATMMGTMVMQTTFAQEAVSNIIERFTTGHVSVLQSTEESEAMLLEQAKAAGVPEEYKGLLFDQDGNEWHYVPPYLEGVYNAAGEPIVALTGGKALTEEEFRIQSEIEEAQEKANMFYVENPDEINNYTAFKVGLPSYLPEGVRFVRAEFYEPNPKESNYVGLIFEDVTGKEVLYLQERLACEEARCETDSAGKIEEVDINGAKGLLYDNSLDWETSETIYLMNGKGIIEGEELLKVARSINE